jgi:hypothetical protein
MAGQRDELMTVEQILAELATCPSEPSTAGVSLAALRRRSGCLTGSCGSGGVSSWPRSNRCGKTRRERHDPCPVLGRTP